MYKSIIRPLMFLSDSEKIHDRALGAMALASRLPFCTAPFAKLCQVSAPELQIEVGGVRFPNRVGLAAGFDKNGRALEMLSALGFGHVELGSVTGQAQAGNPKPRIFRLPEDEAVINRMGFPSEGADAVLRRLQSRRPLNGTVLGINLGKTKTVPLEEALTDYAYSFRALADHGDYFVLNVSSPNTPELRKLQERPRLLELFAGVQELNSGKKPLFVKVAPDLEWAELDDVLSVAEEVGMSGIIATNTTNRREDQNGGPLQHQELAAEMGGLSGKPLQLRSVEFVKYIHSAMGLRLPVIGVGGVFTGEHAFEMLKAGASLVQLYTGFIYEGPFVAKRINEYLRNEVLKVGATSLDELLGR